MYQTSYESVRLNLDRLSFTECVQCEFQSSRHLSSKVLVRNCCVTACNIQKFPSVKIVGGIFLHWRRGKSLDPPQTRAHNFIFRVRKMCVRIFSLYCKSTIMVSYHYSVLALWIHYNGVIPLLWYGSTIMVCVYYIGNGESTIMV